MEPECWFIGVVAFALAEFVWEQYLSLRQHLRFSSRVLPSELDGVVKEEDFTRSQEYNAAKSRLGFVEAAFGAVVSVVILFGGISAVWRYSGDILECFGFLGTGETMQSLVFAGLNLLLSTSLDLPFSVYRAFVLEERFGFNKQTPGLFVKDQILGLVLSCVIGGPLLAVVVQLVRWGGPSFWIYLCIFMAVFQLVLVQLYPTLIAPLFNTFTDLQEGELRTALEELAARVKFPLSKVFVVDGSTRSAHSNAYFYGFFGNKRIVIYDTLLEQVEPSGVEAIVGHELGHYSGNHNAKNFVLAQVQSAAFFYCFGLCINDEALYAAFGFDQQPVLIGLFLFSMVYGPVGHILSLFNNFLSRAFEYEADRFAVELGYDLTAPLAAIHASNASNLSPDPLFSAYHFSHPTLVERIAAMRAHKELVASKTKRD